MINFPSRKLFQKLAFLGLLLSVVAYFLALFRIPTPSKEVNDALDWNFYEASIPIETLQLILLMMFFIYIVSGIGFIFFLSWSRQALVFCVCVSIALMPFQGIYVTTGIFDFINNIGTIMLMVPIVLSFFPPCSGYFEKNFELRVDSTLPQNF